MSYPWEHIILSPVQSFQQQSFTFNRRTNSVMVNDLNDLTFIFYTHFKSMMSSVQGHTWLWPLFIREDVKRADGEWAKKRTPSLIFQGCRFKCAPRWTPQWLLDSWIWLSYRLKSISGILVWKFKNLQVKIQESFQRLNSLDISKKHVDW